MRKIISLLLSVAMLASLLTFAMPVSVFALAAGDRELNDGSTSLIASTSTLKHTFNHAYIGGKSGDDVVGNFVSTSSSDRINGYQGVNNLSTLMSVDVMFTTVSDQIVFVYGPYETATATSGTAKELITISPASGVTKGSYINSITGTVPTSLSLNEWHNIAFYMPNAGSTHITLYIDGVAYTCWTKNYRAHYGTYRNYLHFRSGTVYADNFYKAAGEPGQSLYTVADYQIDELTVSTSNKIAYNADSKTFTCQEGTTVAELKNSITTDCDITVFADDTYKTVLENTDAVTADSALVLSKNNKAFRYYNNFEITEAPKPEDFIGIYNANDGSSALKAMTGFTHTYGHDYIGGKVGDVAGYVEYKSGLERLSNPFATEFEKISGLRTLIAFDVMFTTENDKITVAYQPYKQDGTAGTNGPMINITPAGITKANTWSMDTVKGPSSLSLNEWHNIAIEMPNDGTKKMTLYVDGIEYTCWTKLEAGFGAYRFYATVDTGSFYIDNYYCQAGAAGESLYTAADYNIAEILVTANDKIAYDAENKKFTCQEGVTVEALKQAIETDCDITAFADNTYKTVLEDADAVTADSVLVISKNNTAFRYYSFEITKAPTPEDFIGIYNANDGSSALKAMTGFTHTYGHDYIGGKVGDVAGYVEYKSGLERLSNPFAQEFNKLSSLRTLIAFDVMFTTENDKITVAYQPYKQDGTAGTNGPMINITPAGITKANTWSMDTVKGPSSLSLNEWHNIAVEMPNDGTKKMTLYVDGIEYTCWTRLEAGYGAYRFYATVDTGSFYIDNYYCQAGAAGQSVYNTADYIIAEPEVLANDKIAYDAENKKFISEEGTTVAELKNNITTDCDITVFENNTYKTVLENTDAVTADSVIVISKNSKAFRYYGINLYEAVKEAEIAVNVINGTANVVVNGENKGTAPNKATYLVGTTLAYTAVPTGDDQTFLYWQDALNGLIISNNKTIEVNVGSNASYLAVFADNTGKEIYITFKSNNKILASTVKEVAVIPADPYVAGYTFDGWYLNKVKTEVNLDVTRNTVYMAGFVADPTEYNVSVVGATTEGGKYKYNDKVTVAAAGEDGKVFTYWTRDGKIASYNEEYSFYVSADTVVVANYAESKAEAGVVLVMAEPLVVGPNADKIAFYAERNIPESYTIIETGILMNKTENFDVNTTSAIKAKASVLTNAGQFTVRKANAKGQTWYAKAYVIYSDGENVLTVYSDTVSKTLD